MQNENISHFYPIFDWEILSRLGGKGYINRNNTTTTYIT